MDRHMTSVSAQASIFYASQRQAIGVLIRYVCSAAWSVRYGYMYHRCNNLVVVVLSRLTYGQSQYIDLSTEIFRGLIFWVFPPL